MKDLNGKVAVVTGGASGIGRAMAERFAEEGMKIILSDVQRDALEKAEAEMKADGADVVALYADVSKWEDVEALAARTFEAHGNAHIVCNNAGVGIGGTIWDISNEDWSWVMGVNLWGVIYGIRAFVPTMLEKGESGHIVNTASMAGLTSGPGFAPYNVTKHGVVSLSECLYQELVMAGGTIGVSVVCPGWVDTKIHDADRNRPGGPLTKDKRTLDSFRTIVGAAMERGIPPKEVAEQVLQAVMEPRFYVLSHPEWKVMIKNRMEDILEDRFPTPVSPEDAQ